MLSKVAARKARSLPAAQAIAKALDKPIEEVFPDIGAYHATPRSAKEREQKQAELAAKLKL